MSNSVVGVTREMLQPVDEAIELLKSGNIRAAMDHLQLIDKTRSEELFTRELMALSEGVALVRQNRFDEAAPHLVVAENLIGLIGWVIPKRYSPWRINLPVAISGFSKEIRMEPPVASTTPLPF